MIHLLIGKLCLCQLNLMLTCFQFINWKIINLTFSKLYILNWFSSAVQFVCLSVCLFSLLWGVMSVEDRLNENYFDIFAERILRCFLSAAITLLGKESKNNRLISKCFSKICHPLWQDILDVVNFLTVSDSFNIHKYIFSLCMPKILSILVYNLTN